MVLALIDNKQKNYYQKNRKKYRYDQIVCDLFILDISPSNDAAFDRYRTLSLELVKINFCAKNKIY